MNLNFKDGKIEIEEGSHIDKFLSRAKETEINSVKNVKEIQIDGCVQIPSGQTQDDFDDKFQAWCEQEGYFFGGGTEQKIEGELTTLEASAKNTSVDFGFWLLEKIYGERELGKYYIQGRFDVFEKETNCFNR